MTFPWPLGTIFDWPIATQHRLVDAVFAFLAESGITRVQGSFGALKGGEAKAYIQAIEKHGLISDSVHAFFFDENSDFSVLDKAARAKAVANQKNYIRFAADLGASGMVVHGADAPVEPHERDERFKCSAAGFRELAEFGAEQGVRIYAENLPMGFIPNTPNEVLALLEAVDHPNLGVTFDSGHANLVTGDPVGYLERIVDRVWSLHMHDNFGEKDDHLDPGEGALDWPGIVHTLARGGYDGTFLLEWNAIYFVNARERVEALRRRLQAWAAGV